MPVSVPTRLSDALALMAERPDAHVLAGGTDLMVEVNQGHRRPPAIVAVGRVPELRGWATRGSTLVIGAATTYSGLLSPGLAALAPALAQAARTVGSPQIRNAGTLGGNIGTASPAGDTLPVLSALDARVTLQSLRGTRNIALSQLITGPKRTGVGADELIVDVSIPVARPGDAQEYLKVGTRNAMVIAVASLALVIRRGERTVRVALGSVGPVPIRALEAEALMSDELDWDAMVVADGAAARFAELVAGAARPIDDHRSTAEYRRHAVGVLARRALVRAVQSARRAA